MPMKRQNSGSPPRAVIMAPANAVRCAEDAGPPLPLRMACSQVYQSAPATLRAYKADLANFKAWCLRI